MRKRAVFILLPLLLAVGLALTGCAIADYGIIHRKGNLIVTNYSGCEISDVTITSLDDLIAVSHQSISDTQLCHFTVEPKREFTYTVSFVDGSGKTHSRTFVDSFTNGARVLIAIRSIGNGWLIDYDR